MPSSQNGHFQLTTERGARPNWSNVHRPATLDGSLVCRVAPPVVVVVPYSSMSSSLANNPPRAELTGSDKLAILRVARLRQHLGAVLVQVRSSALPGGLT